MAGSVGLVPRVPEGLDPRLSNFCERVAAILNALFQRGQLNLVGASDFSFPDLGNIAYTDRGNTFSPSVVGYQGPQILNPYSAATAALVVREFASQTANTMEWQDNTGFAYWAMTKNRNLVAFDFQGGAGPAQAGALIGSAPLGTNSVYSTFTVAGNAFRDLSGNWHAQLNYQSRWAVVAQIYTAESSHDNTGQFIVFGTAPGNDPLVFNPYFVVDVGSGFTVVGSGFGSLANGFGNTIPLAPLHVMFSDTGTGSIRNMLNLEHNLTSGTAAAGFGVSQQFVLQDTTTYHVVAWSSQASWLVATHGSTTARYQEFVWDTVGREYFRAESTGAAAKISWFGVTAVARQSGDVATGLVNLGLFSSANYSGLGTVVNQITNSDGTLTISPTTGNVVASLALGHANTWTATQTFDAATSVQLGKTGTATGLATILGTTSGTVTLTVAAVAGTWTLTLPTTAGSANQLLQTNGSGTTTWASAALSVSNSDGTLTISPTTGAVVASLNLGHANTWTANVTIDNTHHLLLSEMTAGSILFAGTSGQVSQDNANLFWDAANHRFGFGTSPAYPFDALASTTSAAGFHFVTVQTTPNSSDTNDGCFSLTYQILANSATNENAARGITLAMQNTLTGGGHLQNAHCVEFFFISDAGSVTDTVDLVTGSTAAGGTVTTMNCFHAPNALLGTNQTGFLCDNLGATNWVAFCEGTQPAGVWGVYIADNLTSFFGGEVRLGGGERWTRTAVNDANYTILATDQVIGYTALTAARTATLPTSVGAKGKVHILKDEAGAAGAHTITLATTGGQTIDGAANKTITTNYGILRVYSDGANWFTW